MSAENALRTSGLGRQQQVPAGASNGAFWQNPTGLHKVQPWQNRPPRSYWQPLQHSAPQPDRASIPELGISEQHLPEPADTKPLAEADPQLSDISKGGEAARDPTVAEKLLEKGFEPYSFEVGAVLASQLAVWGLAAQAWGGQRALGGSGCRLYFTTSVLTAYLDWGPHVTAGGSRLHSVYGQTSTAYV